MVRLISNTKIEKKKENPMMWLKVLRQNINHLTRRARGTFQTIVYIYMSARENAFIYVDQVYAFASCLNVHYK